MRNPRLYPNQQKSVSLAGWNLAEGWTREQWRDWAIAEIMKNKRRAQAIRGKGGFFREKNKVLEQQLRALDSHPNPPIGRTLLSPDGYAEVRYTSMQKGGRVTRETWISEPMESGSSRVRRRNMTAKEANADFAKKVRAGWQITQVNPPAGALATLGFKEVARRNPVQGEWWITDYGVEYADGDVGDMNHELVAFDRVVRDIGGYLGVEFEEYAEPLNEKEPQIRQILEEDGASEADLEVFGEDPEAFITDYLIRHTHIRKDYKSDDQIREAISIAFNGPMYDARDYAMKYMGWKRVAGAWVQTQTISREDLNQIARGLGEIIDQHDSNPGDFNLEVMATGKVYSEVPWKIIKRGDPTKLRPYLDVGMTYNPPKTKRYPVVSDAAAAKWGPEVKRRGVSDTIVVDGVERPVFNSEGRPIHSTPEGVVNFWRWFAGSKVVDKHGRPLVVYHAGTVDPEEDIASSAMHFGTKHAAEDRAAVLPGSELIDELYRDLWFDEDDDSWWVGDFGPYTTREDATDWIVEQARFTNDHADELVPIHAFYLRIIAPKRVGDASVDAPKVSDEDYDPDEDPWEEVVENLPSKFDGLRYRNEFEDPGSLSWVALDPRQIKSATANSGAFSSGAYEMSNPPHYPVMRAYQRGGSWSRLGDTCKRRRNG